MDDLIRRQDAADFLCDWCGICSKEKRNIMECDDIAPNFAKIPPVDAVEVVRCKNCDNFQTDWETAFANGRHYCAIIDSIMPPDGFCSYGERKTDG